MPKADQHNSQWWRARTQECRTAAENISDPILRNQLIEAARGFERMAEQKEQVDKD